MALADFLGKNALSASQVLKDFDYEKFQLLLLAQNIRICFDKKAISSREGFACAEMLVRLLARLYPKLHLQCLDGQSQEREHLHELATLINPFIDLNDQAPTTVIVIGDIKVEFPVLTIYAGSDQWLAKFSRNSPQLCGDSVNRFGAGAAACIAAANLFRHVFREQLPGSALDEELIYSTFNGCIQEQAEQGPGILNVNMGETVLVGLGAIGNGFVWSLKDLNLTGSLHIVDGQRIDRSNLQRYILALSDDIDRQKTDLLNSYLQKDTVRPYPFHYDVYISKRGNWDITRAVVCVDTAEDRRMVQGSLPKKIINAWTQAEQCGLSRHHDFLNDPCVVCLYTPVPEEKSRPVKIAESFGFKIPQHIQVVREYMALNRPVDHPFISLIADIRQIDPEKLLPFTGRSVETFYSEVICGGVMLQLAGGTQEQAAEIPSAFESAMAGIMLAAELVIDCGDLRRQKPATIQKINLLRPITRYTSDAVKKSVTGCICNDEIYSQRYEKKWGRKSSNNNNSTETERPCKVGKAESNLTVRIIESGNNKEVISH